MRFQKITDKFNSRPILSLAIFSLLLFFLSAFLPKQNIYFPNFNFLNVDSFSWLNAAYNFPYNLDIWTSRPLYPFFTFILSKIVSTSGISLIINQFLGFKKYYFIDIYLATLLINFSLYLSSAVIFHKALKKAGENRITCLSGALLFLGSLTSLTWTGQPLPQFFDYFLSSFVFYLLIVAEKLREKDIGMKRVFLVALAIGILFLAKTALWALVFGIIYLITRRKYISAVLFGMISMSMIFTWSLVIQYLFKMPWYDHGIQSYHFGVWLIEALRESNYYLIITTLNVTLLTFMKSLRHTFFIPLLILLAIMLFTKKIQSPKISVSLVGLFFLSLFLMFFAMQGAFYPRLAFTAFPIVFWLLAINLTSFFDRFFPKNPEKAQLFFLVFLAILNIALVPFFTFS